MLRPPGPDPRHLIGSPKVVLVPGLGQPTTPTGTPTRRLAGGGRTVLLMISCAGIGPIQEPAMLTLAPSSLLHPESMNNPATTRQPRIVPKMNSAGEENGRRDLNMKSSEEDLPPCHPISNRHVYPSSISALTKRGCASSRTTLQRANLPRTEKRIAISSEPFSKRAWFRVRP